MEKYWSNFKELPTSTQSILGLLFILILLSLVAIIWYITTRGRILIPQKPKLWTAEREEELV